MIRYQVLGQSNFAVAILLDIVRQVHSEHEIVAEICGNIPRAENPSLAHSCDVEGVTTFEVPLSRWRRDPDARVLLGSIGRARRRIVEFFSERFGVEAAEYARTVHPGANLPLNLTIGHGVHIGPGASIAPHAVLGDFVVVNRNASIGHHTKLGSFVAVNPGATVAGVCTLGDDVTIGAGATVIDGITIGAGTVIGAGSVVTKNLGENLVAYGVPARVVRRQER